MSISNYQSIPYNLGAIDWMVTALDLDKLGYLDDALDVLFRHVDELMTAGRFFEVDQILRMMGHVHCTLSFALGVLTITFHGKRYLLNRHDYYEQLKTDLNNNPERDALLAGLE